ncbi:MAG TPA: GDP-mannose 4,6-dehydratase, partial [Candidatus Moranbacteria bacterium]|nr:GDP-mannose 4,6-dehydratase [Candidatus Moranbacteria bacterium]
FNVDLINMLVGLPTQNPLAEIRPVFEKMESYYADSETKPKGSFKFFEADIVDAPKMNEIFKENKFDAVIHLAAWAGVPMSIEKPLTYVSVNVSGTANLLDACRKFGVKKFVFGSSSSVYGDRGGEVVNENDDVMHAVSPYGATKVAGEVLCHAASKVYGTNIVVNRLFGPIYGPLQRLYGMFNPRAINYAYNDKELSIFGRKGLESAKDCTYIDDQVDAFIKMLDYETQFDVFNIGTGNPQSIKTCMEIIEKYLGKPVKYKIVEVDKGDVASSADISKARKLLGYEPKMDIEKGIRRQVEIFQLMPEWYKKMERV